MLLKGVKVTMKNISRKIAYLLVCILLSVQILPVCVYGEETEWYEMVEEDFESTEISDSDIQLYMLYIMDVITSITKISSTKVGIRADVPCSATMKTITVTIYLQKSTGSSWVNVASQTLSSSNVSSTTKKVTVSGLSSGAYRGKVAAKVTDKYGYAETLTGYSGALTL